MAVVLVLRGTRRNNAMTPVEIDVVFPLLTGVAFTCRRCGPLMGQLDIHKNYQADCGDEYPEDWKQNVEKLSLWIENASQLYKHRIQIRVIDAFSPLGIWKKIRHRLTDMPAFIVDNKSTHTGWDTDRLETLIDERIREASAGLVKE
jgi:hypothetical protein